MNQVLEDLATVFDLESLRQFTHEERVEILTKSIEEMAGSGTVSPQDVKEMLRDLNKWLLEHMGDA